MKLIFKILFRYIFLSNQLLAVEFFGKFEQGSFILGKTKPKSKIEIDNKCEDNHTIMNEPDKFILQYWEPKISLEEGIKKIIDNNSFL